MRIANLEGAQLDYWVARAQGIESIKFNFEGKVLILEGKVWTIIYSPSTDWSQGGPIIDSERMTFATTGTGPRGDDGFEPVVAITYTGRRAMEGPSHLIAGMRAYLASKFGENVPNQENP